MKYNFDQIVNRRTSESVKWHAYGEHVLPMWVADMDFISPQPVIDALQRRVAHGIFGYPSEVPELRSVIVEWIANRYRWHVKAEDLVFIPGVVKGFNLACHLFDGQGGEVVVQTPLYPPMLGAGELVGMSTRQVELIQKKDGIYEIDWESFEDALEKQARLFILCNPHNPTGRVFTKAELERMGELCLRHNVLICSDEIHCDLIFQGQQHIPIAGISEELAQHTITLIAPSKTFNIAGLEFSVAIIPNEELRKKYMKSSRGLVGWPNLLGGTAALAAYQDGLEWLDQVLVYLQGNRDYLFQYIKEQMPNIHMGLPEGTYLAWLDCRDLQLEENPHNFFLGKARVAVNDGKMFGKGGEGFVRLNFGCPRATIQEALEKMKAALKSRS